MAAITNGSGKNRVAPVIRNTPAVFTSLDDDEHQKPGQVVGFTTQSMITTNVTANPYQMIV